MNAIDFDWINDDVKNFIIEANVDYFSVLKVVTINDD